MSKSLADFLGEILIKGDDAGRIDLLLSGFKLYFQGVARRLLPGSTGQREYTTK